MTCSFCSGQPVTDAASWLDGKPRPPAPCPRCGEVGAKRCRQCGGPVPAYKTSHKDLQHVTADDFCRRECAEDFHGVVRRPIGLGMYK